MPIPGNLIKLQIDWSIDGGQEIAVNTLSMALSAVHPPGQWNDLQAYTDALGTAFKGSFSQLASSVHSSCYVKDLKLYQIDPTTGKAGDGGAHSFAATDCVGLASGSPYPPVIAGVATLWGYNPSSFTVHPRRKRGRMFIPGVTSGMSDGAGMPLSTYQTNVSNGLKALIDALNGVSAADGTNGQVCVYSRVDESLSGVQAISVSSLWGVQKRREDALVATHNVPVTV